MMMDSISYLNRYQNSNKNLPQTQYLNVSSALVNGITREVRHASDLIPYLKIGYYGQPLFADSILHGALRRIWNLASPLNPSARLIFLFFDY